MIFYNMEQICYRGWDSVRLSSSEITVILPLDIGPRILHVSVPNGENLFYEENENDGKTKEPVWHNYGGHRLWHGPQVGDRPNEPDNERLDFSVVENGICLKQKPERMSLLQKQMLVEITDTGVRVTHTLTNTGVWAIKCTAWALSVMKPGGRAILPLPLHDTHYLPSYALAFWPWTKPNDPRVTYGGDYMLVSHDPINSQWYKVGYGNTRKWAAYMVDGAVFIKTFDHQLNAEYSDYGASCECYADNRFIEIESLSPLTDLHPGESISHIENWMILSGASLEERADVSALISHIDKLVAESNKN